MKKTKIKILKIILVANKKMLELMFDVEYLKKKFFLVARIMAFPGLTLLIRFALIKSTWMFIVFSSRRWMFILANNSIPNKNAEALKANAGSKCKLIFFICS